VRLYGNKGETYDIKPVSGYPRTDKTNYEYFLPLLEPNEKGLNT
jgi:hypothetical protein